MQLNSRKALLESDLLYSIRHLLLSLESGTALINSLESVSKLNTKSSIFFKELVFDISLGIPIEEALTKAIEYSPSKAYTKILLEISTSLETGADLQKTLKNSLEDITKNHLILIKEYGKKLNPMSMFYMMIGTIMPSLGTAGLIVASSLLPGIFVIDLRILLAITFLLLILQLFFVLAFRSLKPAVME
jgi:pilus assembly protein TadC